MEGKLEKFTNMEIKPYTPKYKIKYYLEINENGNNTTKFMGCHKSNCKTEVYSNKYIV
jgi:hypothetical protein